MNPLSPYSCSSRRNPQSMSCGMTRRQWLVRSTAAAGLWALADWRNLLHAAEDPPPAHLPNLSQSAPSLPVSIQRCESYEPALVRQRLDAALDEIGGLG